MSALREPPEAVAELGILTDRTESALFDVLDRDRLASRIGADLCGDSTACQAVRQALKDDRTTTVRIAKVSEWLVNRTDLDASASTLAPRERATLAKRDTVVIVRVAAARSARQLPIRAAFAAAASIAAEIDGLVDDELLGRVEDARAFAKHVVTAPLDASAFRVDRVQVLYEPAGETVARLLTAGLERFGAPDVEMAAAPIAGSERMSEYMTELVLGVAEAIAKGARTGPIVLSAADLARAVGAPTEDAGRAEVAVEIVSVHPEAGDPNDFIARIEPPAGDGPLGYLELAERFFGPVVDAPPDETALRAERERAQRMLAPLLTQWTATRRTGARLLVRLPFAIAGDAGVESMWVEVTGYDGRALTGLVVDEPVAVTDIARGDRVTRLRSEVEDVRVRSR